MDTGGVLRLDGPRAAQEHGRHLGVRHVHVGDFLGRQETVRRFQ